MLTRSTTVLPSILIFLIFGSALAIAPWFLDIFPAGFLWAKYFMAISGGLVVACGIGLVLTNGPVETTFDIDAKQIHINTKSLLGGRRSIQGEQVGEIQVGEVPIQDGTVCYLPQVQLKSGEVVRLWAEASLDQIYVEETVTKIRSIWDLAN